MEAAKEAGSQTLLIDKFLKNAIEVDVDCVADGKRCVIGGVMQHIEEAVHTRVIRPACCRRIRCRHRSLRASKSRPERLRSSSASSGS